MKKNKAKMNLMYTKTLMVLFKLTKLKCFENLLSKRAEIHVNAAIKTAQAIMSNGSEEEKEAFVKMMNNL